MLSRTAAERAGLQHVGLDFRDLYGVIHAESSWVARDGLGKNGVVSRGVAQFEPATAKAVGLRNPDDTVESVHAAARLLREAAAWSAEKVDRLRLPPDQRAARLREGVSIYYNLSTRGRALWNGLNTSELPVETLRHIRNMRVGALKADRLNEQLGGPRLAQLPAQLPSGGARLASAAVAKTEIPRATPAKPQALGTIEWAGRQGEPGGRQRYVVWSNGAVQRQAAAGEVPAGAIQWTRRSG